MFQKVEITEFDINKIPYYPKPLDQMEELINHLKNSFLTKGLASELVNTIAGAMKKEIYSPGQTIIKYGDEGTHFFILHKGSAKVVVYEPQTDPNDPQLHNKIKFTKLLNEGVGFGELALILNDKRSATI